MLWEQKVEYAVQSDIGFRRRNNQDSFAVQIAPDREIWERRGHLFLVADGMGGHAVGELASKLAADTIPHTFFKSTEEATEFALQDAITTAHRAIHERGNQNRDFTRMGTTCTTLVLSPRGAILGHVGDSRCYRIRGGRIEQLTFDHSLQWELLRQGRMSPEEIFLQQPRNVITRSLGPEPSVEVDVEGPYVIHPGDVYLLCSDGLSGLLKDEEIGTIAGELPPPAACRLLVDLANLRGGSDNITVLIARVGEPPPGAVALPPPEPPARESQYGWGWLAGFLAVGVTFVTGLAAAMLDRPVEGVYIEALAVVGMGALILCWLRFRRERREPILAAVSAGTPYRTASAQVTSKFVSDLARMESGLQKNAHEEGWTVNWEEHDLAFKAAKAALLERQYSLCLKHYASSIRALMSAVQQHRRQSDKSIKWGTKPTN